MKSTQMLIIALGVVGATGVLSHGQAPAPAAPRTGPGVQAAQDAKEPEVLAACKTPPPARGGGRGRGRGAAGAAAAPAGPRDYAVTEIPGVIAAGTKWTEVMAIDGNNADGIIATKDGGILMAQNDKSDVAKLDKNGKLTVVYSGLNTSGSLAMNSKGVLFVANRGLNPSIDELAPKKKVLANKSNGDPLDCIGGVLNDIVADSKGGVYFTMAGLWYANPKGEVMKYGENLNTNGIILSPDEKTVYVTNAGTLAALDVQPDGSLTNQREFVKWEGGGGDGSTFDGAGRLYVTSTAGIQVISPEGKILGVIPAPRGLISLAFSGPDRKTLYAVGRDGANNQDWILSIPTIAQGPKGRGK
jgi:gluconolactonase